MDRAEIIQYLSSNVSLPRLEHCIRVEETALELAPRFNVAPALVTPAALLHDLCREYKPDSLLKLAINFGIVIDDIERSEPLLLHGFVAAAMVEERFRETEPSVLEAISFHITGAPGVSSLARLIFIADFIEPGRMNEQARILREMAPKIDPEELLLKVYNRTIIYVLNHGYLIHPRSILGRNELIQKGVKEN
jgi:predicted HD superfamily hydrolase involved in NAD metabolism